MTPPAANSQRIPTWLAPARPSRTETRVKGSRFLADITRATTALEATRHLKGLHAEFPRATHHCWALRVHDGSRRLVERCSDAGEPSGTAGQPILRALQAAGTEEVSLVVVRWFGGTKLGVGPLGRAYRDAAVAALDSAGTQRRRRFHLIELHFPFEASAAMRRILHHAGARIRQERAAGGAELLVAVPAEAVAALRQSVLDVSRGQAEVHPLGITTGAATNDGE